MTSENLSMNTENTPPDNNSENGNTEKKTIENDNCQNLNIENLSEKINDKETAQLISELIQGQKIASVYIDARSGGLFFSGDTKITGDVAGRTLNKEGYDQSDKIFNNQIIGQIIIQDIEKVDNVYVKTSSYEKLQQALLENHVLIVWGQAHYGKWTTALKLLSSSSLSLNNIFEIKPDVTFDEIFSLNIESQQGYIIDTLAGEIAESIDIFLMNRLSNRFKNHNSYLIITVDHRHDIAKDKIENFLFNWNVIPDSLDILKKHLYWYLKDKKQFDQIIEIVTKEDEILKVLKSSLLPRELDKFSELMIKVANNELELTEAISRFKSHAIKQVEEWFENNHELDKRIFIISLSALNGASYQDVIMADEHLNNLINPNVDETEKNASQVFSYSRKQKIKNVRAHLSQGFQTTEFGKSPVELIEFDNISYQPAVLHHVWIEYDPLRKILVKWLREIAFSNYDVRMRVAAAVGELLKYDFNYVKSEILLQWANHEDIRPRVAAAFALGIPAWEGEFAPQVLGLLHHWSTIRNNWRLQWTSAAAFGGLVGLRFPDVALRDIYNISLSEDIRLFSVLNNSIFNIFSAGELSNDYYMKVLTALNNWINTSPNINSRLVGVLIFLNLLSTNKTRGIPDANKWYTFFVLLQESEKYENLIATTWRSGLNNKSSRKIALQSLKILIHAVDDDLRLYPTMESFIKKLIHNGSSSHEKERLCYYLNHWIADSNRETSTAEKLLKIIS